MDGGQVNAGAKVITAEQWAQCENPSCEKWRLLPPGTVLNENEPWYCYMNPDPQKNSCDAPEAVCIFNLTLLTTAVNLYVSHICIQEYDETNELILDANYKVPKTAVTVKDIPEMVIQVPQPMTKPPAPKPKAKKRGRPKGAKNHTGVGGDPRQRMVSFADDDADDFGSRRSGRDNDDPSTRGQKQSAKCLVNILNSMIDKGFVLPRKDSSKSTGKPQKEVPINEASWEALSKMAPDAVAVACQYADIYNSLSMMNGQINPKQDIIKDSSSVEMQLRIASLFAAAKGLCTISDGMSLQDRTDWDVIDDSGFYPIQAYLDSQHVEPTIPAAHPHPSAPM